MPAETEDKRIKCTACQKPMDQIDKTEYARGIWDPVTQTYRECQTLGTGEIIYNCTHCGYETDIEEFEKMCF